MKHIHRRPYQEDFLRWLDESQQYMKYAPQDVVVMPGSVAFSLAGLSSLLRVQVFDNSVCVEVQYRGLLLTELIRFSMTPAFHEESGRFYCEHCLHHEGNDRLYPNREIMAREHLYLPLFRWLTENLDEREFIEIVQFQTGAITARQWPYSYSTQSMHFEDFWEQLETKFELMMYSHFKKDYRHDDDQRIAGFYFASLFDKPVALTRFIDLRRLRARRKPGALV